MGTYRIFWKKSALKDLDSIDQRYIPKIIRHIELLSENPFQADVKKIKGSENLYRLRVGPYRVLYHVSRRNRIIIILYIRHRKDAYRQF